MHRFGLGLGLKFSGVFNRRRRPRYPRRSRWTRDELQRHDEQFDRAPPRRRGLRPVDYAPLPFNDNVDFGE
jgi:hypothetical protein